MRNHPHEVALLSGDDEKALAHEIEVGVVAGAARASGADPGLDAELALLESRGREAWQRFANANVRLVWLVVTPMVRRLGLDADELFQEGYLGLLDAMMRYDHRREARFATFALPWIRMYVSNAASSSFGGLGLPPRRARLWRQMRRVESELAVGLGRLPDDAELSRALAQSLLVVRGLRAHRPSHPLPIDDSLAAPEPAEPGAWRPLHTVLAGLPAQQRAVIERRFGFGAHHVMSCAEIAAELGVSESTVRRREIAAMATLRDAGDLLAA